VGINNEFIAVSKGISNFTYETSTISPDGQVIHKLISWAVVSGHEYDYSKVIVIVQDVSELKQLAEKLRENEERYRLLFENAGIVIGCYDLKGTIGHGRQSKSYHWKECERNSWSGYG
jgi:PAS domain-containing protein